MACLMSTAGFVDHAEGEGPCCRGLGGIEDDRCARWPVILPAGTYAAPVSWPLPESVFLASALLPWLRDSLCMPSTRAARNGSRDVMRPPKSVLQGGSSSRFPGSGPVKGRCRLFDLDARSSPERAGGLVRRCLGGSNLGAWRSRVGCVNLGLTRIPEGNVGRSMPPTPSWAGRPPGISLLEGEKLGSRSRRRRPAIPHPAIRRGPIAAPRQGGGQAKSDFLVRSDACAAAAPPLRRRRPMRERCCAVRPPEQQPAPTPALPPSAR